jgi:hypothetical protein
MAKSEFSFSSAPNSAGSIRQFGTAAAVGIGKLLKGKKESDGGLTHGERADLMARQHEYNVREKVAGHVVGEMGAEAAHKRGQRAERAKSQRADASAKAAHERTLENRTHAFDTLSNAATNPAFKSINLNTGSAAFHPQKKGSQFGGVGEATDLNGM